MPTSSPPAKVRFFYQDVNPTLRNRQKLKSFLVSLFRKEGRTLDSINYIFCTDKALLEINRQFLNHDFFTDIITFDLSETGPITAEVYISVDRVRENARDLNIPFKTELHRVILHGALHLCGFSDKTLREKTIMRNREDHYLKLISFS